MGFHYIRRESDVEKWGSQDWRVKRAHEVYAKALAQFKLTEAQKVLLLYNTSGMHRHSCISICLGMTLDIFRRHCLARCLITRLLIGILLWIIRTGIAGMNYSGCI